MDDLKARIAARVIRELDQQARGGFEVGDGQVALVDDHGVPRLRLDDLARVAADEARGWF